MMLKDAVSTNLNLESKINFLTYRPKSPTFIFKW